MTEQEFAAIRRQWRETRTLDTDQRIDSLIRAIEERDAYLHDLTLDASTLSRRAVEEFAAGLVEWLKGERGNTPHPDYDELHSGMRIAYGSVIRHIQETVSSKAPDPLPPDRVRAENERLRERLREIRFRVEDYLDTMRNCGGKWAGVEAALKRLREMAEVK